MKKSIVFFVISFFTLVCAYNTTSAQQICMVSADFDTAEKFFVVWEKPIDPENYDSVYVYRKMGSENNFTKIGGVSMNNDMSFYMDLTSNTIINTYYRISFVDLLGNEGTLSPWHRPVILDYIDGLLIWNKYEKEDQIDETWIAGYACNRDETGLGLFSTMGYWETVTGGTQTSWFDSQALQTTDFIYQMGVDMPNCYVSKANINTSRSNIKRQSANSEASIQENGSTTSVMIAPNPVSDLVTFSFDNKYAGQTYMITDAKGKIVKSGTLAGNTLEINMSDTENGTYFFTIDLQGTFHSKVFIKG
jgi:hypothetical protein